MNFVYVAHDCIFAAGNNEVSLQFARVHFDCGNPQETIMIQWSNLSSCEEQIPEGNLFAFKLKDYIKNYMKDFFKLPMLIFLIKSCRPGLS